MSRLAISRRTAALLAFLTLALIVQRGVCAALTFIYEAESFGSSASGYVVSDPDALNGTTLEAHIGRETPGIMRFGPYAREPAGRYRADFRLKVKDNTIDQPVVGFDVVETGGAAVGSARELKGTDFAKPATYQDFSIEFDRSDIGGMEYRIYWRGGTDVWADRITVTQLKPYGEAELLALYAKRPELLPQMPPTPLIVGGQGKVLICNGLWHEYFRLADALKMLPALQATQADFSVEQFRNVINGFPKTYAELYAYDAVLLLDCSANALGMAGKVMLNHYVKDGGGLVVTGGIFAYGRGGFWESRLLGELLPVGPTRTLDLMPAPSGLRLQGVGRQPIALAARWGDAVTLWYHEVAPRDGAQVVVKAGKQPAVVVGTCGKGKVVCLTIAPMGEPRKNQTAFWTWSEFPNLMAETITWVTTK